MKIDSSKKYIFVGDSQIQYAVNDTIFTDSKNLAIDSECYYYSYFRIKALIDANPELKTIYLGFNYHSFSAYWDNYIEGSFSVPVSSRYFYLMPPEEKLYLIETNRDKLYSYVLKLVENGILNLFSSQKAYDGGFENTFSHSVADEEIIIERIKYQFYDHEDLLNFSDKNILYFNKIIELCEASDIDLVLVNTPVHELYRANVPEKFIQKYNQVFYGTQLNVLDLSDLQLKDSCFYMDGDHLSQTGSVLTTEHLVELLN